MPDLRAMLPDIPDDPSQADNEQYLPVGASDGTNVEEARSTRRHP